MAETRSGIFTVQEFNHRKDVLRIAPDAFISINGAVGARIVSPANTSGYQSLDVRGGVTSVSVQGSVSPPGASRATIEVIAPQYKGLHEDYYVTLPNGVRIPYFIPMMEIKIYMKGRFLESEYNKEPRYYPVFWGLITNVTESYNGGVSTFSIACEDLLSWWKYQKISVRPSDVGTFFGGAVADRYPSVFMNMSAWDIIYALFMDSFFVQKGNNGQEAFFNFIYPQLSKTGVSPDSGTTALKQTFGALAKNTINYWNKRFGFDVSDNAADPNRIPLEMFGLVSQVNLNTIKDRLPSFLDGTASKVASQTDTGADLDLNFNLLARVQPKGSFSLFGQGSEPLVNSKLEIATNVCEQVQMEFFVDMNGHFVFKPPFYNLDVASGNIPYYRISPADIISFNSNMDSNNIVNYLVATGPMFQTVDNLEAIGFHIDYQLMREYGIRYEEISVRYGYNALQLRLIAAAEMTRRNGMAYTGSVSVPLRPELRLGYPIYIEHLDMYYYVTNINHNVTFGQSATTDISFQYRRERVFDEGDSGVPGSFVGNVLKSCVYRYMSGTTTTEDISKSKIIKDLQQEATKNNKSVSQESIEQQANEILKQRIQEKYAAVAGPKNLGYYRIDKAQLLPKSQELLNSGTANAISSNELVMMTNETIPFTDLNGYRHMGAFPYGANLMLIKGDALVDWTDPAQVSKAYVSMQQNAGASLGEGGAATSSNVESTNVAKDTGSGKSDKTAEETERENKVKLDKARETQDRHAQDMNPQSNPSSFKSSSLIDENFLKSGLKKYEAKAESTRTHMTVPIPDPSTEKADPNKILGIIP